MGRLNRFEVAHLADFVLAADYINRFFPDDKKLPKLKLLPGFDESKLRRELGKVLLEAVKDPQQIFSKEGEILFELDEPDSRHYFVTLHALRALSILDAEHRFEPEHVERLSNHARQFCTEQCFYTHRRIRHRQDTFRLAFAGVIYCLYARSVDKELCMAVIEALAEAQQENGRWMSTHPIDRPGKGPWHIVSHEIALCLTWLYFQPRVPDVARVLLIDMMEKYFTKWVVPTFVRVTKLPNTDKEKDKPFKGWYGDHTVERDSVVGWATAIICHFLANYHAVLDDHINRRVIETLGLQASSGKYLIDETAHEKSPRWTKPVPEEDALDSEDRPGLATWPDIKPFAWQGEKEWEELARDIQEKWTDPSERGSLSKKLAYNVLLPVLNSPNGRPDKASCAGILPGVPGTRKTTLVRTLAEVIEWPLVIVPASVIFEKGFDMMEARANEVFRRLNYLSGCVIFFDEFEEFFRDRRNLKKPTTKGRRRASGEGPDSPIHDRTIAAFTTSAMLPRLQDLHDEARCLIFLATNHLEKIDPAIMRPGRFDFMEWVEHPTRRRISAYLKRPTKITLERDMGLHVTGQFRVKPEDRDKRERICKAVKKALVDTLVKQNIEDLVEKNHKNNEVIRFAFVERALRDVAKEMNPKVNDDALKKFAVKSLTKSLKRATESKNYPARLDDPPVGLDN